MFCYYYYRPEQTELAASAEDWGTHVGYFIYTERGYREIPVCSTIPAKQTPSLVEQMGLCSESLTEQRNLSSVLMRAGELRYNDHRTILALQRKLLREEWIRYIRIACRARGYSIALQILGEDL